MTETKLTAGDLAEANAPIPLFAQWLDAAGASEPNDPSAVALATVDGDGLPDVRMVLLKAFDERGFVFYTNYESAKGREILATGKAAMCFHWKSLRRQVRLRGVVEKTTAEEADVYFASRARKSQLGALASSQSRPLESRAVLEDKVSALDRKYEGQPVPRPVHWSGFRLVPSTIEFWQDGANRLHDRFVFEPVEGGDGWRKTRLYP